jgi:hypothetical protein
VLRSLEVVACGTTEVCVCDKAHKGGVGAAGVVLPNKTETTAEHLNLDPNHHRIPESQRLPVTCITSMTDSSTCSHAAVPVFPKSK